jgi:hypothetical protein
MVRIFLVGLTAVAGVCAVVLPAALGISGNTSFDREIQVPLPSQARTPGFGTHPVPGASTGTAPARTTPVAVASPAASVSRAGGRTEDRSGELRSSRGAGPDTTGVGRSSSDEAELGGDRSRNRVANTSFSGHEPGPAETSESTNRHGSGSVSGSGARSDGGLGGSGSGRGSGGGDGHGDG